MKNRFCTFSILGLISILSIFSSQVMAQNTATGTATASATILTPITIVKVTDLNFGNIASGTAGTVVMTAAGVRTATGPVLPAVPGTVTAASFTISGEATKTYTVTLPTTISLAGPSSSTMTVTTFTSNPTTTVGAGVLGGTAAAAGAIASGSQTLTVGGTLNVGANQAAGFYTIAGGLSVTVAYN